MRIFLFLSFYNFIKGFVRIYIIFFKQLGTLFLSLTDELVPIFITFNRTDVSLISKKKRKSTEKVSVLIF